MLTELLPPTQSAGFPHKVANSLPQQLVSQFIVLLWNRFGVDNTKTIQMFEIWANPFIIVDPGFVVRLLLSIILFWEKKIHYSTAIRITKKCLLRWVKQLIQIQKKEIWLWHLWEYAWREAESETGAKLMTINLMENSLFCLFTISCKKPYLKISSSIKVQFRIWEEFWRLLDSQTKDQKRGRERERAKQGEIK